MSYYEAADQTESDDDLWHVQLASGDVCLMTLDQLDEAFHSGVIHENTYLWQEGSAGWVTLREVAGLDADDDSGQEAPAANGATDRYAETAPYASTYGSSDSAWPSVSAPPSYEQNPFAPPLQVVGTHSTAPVVSPLGDMEFDIEPVSFRKKKGSGAKWLFAVAVIGAAGFGAVKYNLLPIQQPGLSAPAAAVSPVPAAIETASPVNVAVVPPAPAPVESERKLADDVKQRLANADKALASKQKVKQQQLQQTRAAAPRSSRPKSSMGGEKVFQKGGETGDPLNSAL